MLHLRRNVLRYKRAVHGGLWLRGVVLALHVFTEMVLAAGVVLGMGLPQSTELSTDPRGAAILSPG